MSETRENDPGVVALVFPSGPSREVFEELRATADRMVAELIEANVPLRWAFPLIRYQGYLEGLAIFYRYHQELGPS